MPPAAAPQPIGSNLPLQSSLPRVSFRQIPDAEAKILLLPAGVSDNLNVSYGFNDGSTFTRPEHYMRYVEPIEAELKKQVEYDMDEQDKEWLDALNLDRRKNQLDPLSYEAFEIIIDRLEKEWFDLMKRVPPKPQPTVVGPDGEPVTNNEDTECAICDDAECENSNAIVFCDGCNLAVHQDCYGIPYIPEGQWLCRKCTVSPDRAVSCVLCPNEGGAFKQTTQGKWAHLLCAMWIAETGVSNPVYMEPIDSVERIPKTRWALRCYLCKKGPGACIQCSHKACGTAFHVTCARKAGLLLRTERQRAAHSHGSDDEDEVGEDLKALCHKHLPKRLRPAKPNRPALNSTADGDDSSTRGSTPVLPTIKPASRKITIRRGANGVISAVAASPPTTNKAARAYKKSYKAGPPLVPSFVIDRVLEYVAKIPIRKRQPLILQIARFWSLKREARRGAALLKRLHLEPWTASSAAQELTESERIKKLQFVFCLREDLERLRMLAELVRKREREKLRQVDLIRQNLVDGVFFPLHAALQDAFVAITSLDRNELFANPVSRSDVPDYYEVIRRPMDWATVSLRIKEQIYGTVQEFADDIQLVLRNAMTYNKPDTPFHRAAARIQKAAEPILHSLTGANSVHRLEALREGGDEAAAARNAAELQLEPPYSSLELLEDYSDERRAFTVAEGDSVVSAPANLIRDLLRQYPKQERAPPKPKPGKKRAPPPRTRNTQRVAAEPSSATDQVQDAQHRDTAPSMPSDSQAQPDEVPIASASALATLPEEFPGQTTTSELSLPTRARAVTMDSRAAHPVRTRTGAEAEEGLAAGSRTRSATDTLTEKSEQALSTVELNDWDTFKRFEQGWILPEGSRRKNRGQRVEDPPPPAPASRKKTPVKMAAQPAAPQQQPRRQTYGSGNKRQKLGSQPAPPAVPDAGPASSDLSDLSDLSDAGETIPRRATTSRSTTRSRPVAVSHQPLHTQPVDTQPVDAQPESSTAATLSRNFDTPRASQRPRRSSLQHSSSDVAPLRAETSPPTVAASSTKRKRSATESPVNERLSKSRAAASGSGDTPVHAEPQPNGAAKAHGSTTAEASQSPAHSRTSAKNAHNPSATSTSEVEQWPSGAFVWAHLRGFPFYPAQVLLNTSSEVLAQPSALRRMNIPNSALKAKRGGAGKRYLVRFFDEVQSLGWVVPQNLQPLFQDDRLDGQMTSGMKKRHTPSIRADIEGAVQSARDAKSEQSTV